MTEYQVEIEVTGIMTIVVEAENEDAAREAAEATSDDLDDLTIVHVRANWIAPTRGE